MSEGYTMHDVRAHFYQVFQKEPILVIAPGRINLIGEHTDYNNGFVMPAAVDKHFVFAMAANGSDTVNCVALDLNEKISFRLTELIPGNGWAHYLMGVLQGLRNTGFEISGVDCMFTSTIPAGAGLSSSAALCCGFGFGMGELFGLNLSKLTIAKIAQFSEHKFAGVMCGIMDQYASLFGEKDAALLLDCQSLKHETLPFQYAGYSILLIDTRVKHSLASTGYNDRRASCEEAVAVLRRQYPGVKSLRDVTVQQLDEYQDTLGEEVYIKSKYVAEEIARTQAAARWLKANELGKFGQLMFQTHWGLSRMYDVSCPELDHLVQCAEEHPSMVCGARMMGGGFGGCTINLVRKENIDYLKGYIHEKYFATFGSEPDFYTVALSRGVHKSGM
jgi:galactokinase